ncbi:hypothetical protein RhiirA4_487410 [Rhizophagus irregularis]|uniref:Uncharacterized protein n=1 Tax=Rhizophagus irregularis TaxID=588596 RepID=A0A2I1HSK4_9GLOM|nr:hypothetical protein RhiirA4_487410 [Rhizophagus irregularis]
MSRNRIVYDAINRAYLVSNFSNRTSGNNEMFTWEISSRRSPFCNYEHNYDLTMITNGIRPKIVPGTPLE